MKIRREGWAMWNGGFKGGRGKLSTHSGALRNVPYGYSSRFEDQVGTNPEELIGAAHAGCFTMALALLLEQASFVPKDIETSATVALEELETGFEITSVHLVLRAKVLGLTEELFQTLASQAKTTCPISGLLKAAVTLEARLES